MALNILITGAGSVMGQSIYKALAMHQFDDDIHVHFANSEELGAGRFFNQPGAPVVAKPIFPIAVDENYSDLLQRYINENLIDVVFSGTQHELEKIALYRDHSLKAATISSHIANICMDKTETARVLGKKSIKVPKTCTLDEYLLDKNISGSIVIKPNHSSSSRSIYYADDYNKALKLIEETAIDTSRFLVQEKLLGDEYTCGCYIDRYDGSINTIIFKRTLTPDGATSYGEIIKNDEINRYLLKVCHALIEEGLDFGHINVQLILTRSGPALFEINGRLSSTEASKAYYGFNSCAAFVENIVYERSYKAWDIKSKGKFLRYYEELYFE